MDKLFKRKKQETDGNDDEEEDLEEGVDLPLLPKRTKVQAQRKFAQGSSPMVTPVKEAPVEVDITPIVPMAPVFTQPPVNQPKTEDFLTYLCFRGTSLVSRRLSDMFSTPSPVVHSTSDQKNSTAKKIRKKRLTEEDLMGKGKLSRQKMSAAPLKKLKQQDQTRMRGVLPPHSAETKAPSSRKQQQFKTKDISVVKKPGVGGGPGRKPKPAGVLRKAQMTQRERLKSRHATSSVASSRSGLRSSGILSSGIEEGLPPRKRHRHLTLTSAGVRKGQGAVGSKRAVLQRNKHIGVVKCAPNQKKQRATRHKMSDEVSLPASKTSVVASVRPSRKSKEAAAVYMDLLGEEVKNPEAFDEDDNSSVESFPELPKARTMERRERQIREMVAAQKEKAESKTPISKPSTQPKTVAPRIASKKLTVQSLLKKRLTRSSLKQPKLRKQPTGKDVTLDKRKTRAKLRDRSKTDLEESKTKDIEESSEGMTNTRPSRNVRTVQNKSSERNESPKLRRTRSDNSPVVTVDELSPGKLSKVTMRKDETHTETQSNEDSANKSKESRVTDNDRPDDGKKTKANTKDERKVNAQDEEQSKTNDKVKTRATRSVRKANEEVNDGEKRESETKTKKESKAGSKVCDDEKKPESEERTKEEINNPEGVNTTPKNLDAKSKNDTEDKGGTNRKKKIKPSMQQKIDFDEIVRDETFVSKNRAAKSTNDERKGKPESQGKAKKKKDIEENNVTVFVTKVDVEKVVDSGSPLKPRDISSKIYVADSKEKAQAVKAITFEEKEQAAPCSTAQEVLSCSTISPSTPSNCPPQTANNQTKETNKISPDSSVVPSKTLLKMKSSGEINDNSNVGDSKQWKEEELNKVQAPSLSFQNAYGNKTDQDPKVSPKLMKSTAKLITEVKANTAQSKTSSADKIPETQEDTDKMSTDPRNNTSNKVKRVQLTPSKIVTQLNSSTSSNLNKVTVPEDKMWNSKDNSPHTSSSILSVNSNSTLKPRSRATLFVKGSDNSNLSPMIQIADTFRLNFGKDAEKKDSKQMSKKETNISESTIAELDKELSNFVKDIVKSDWDGKNFDIPLNRPIRDTGSKARKQISTIDFINSTPVKCSSNEEINIRNDKVIISPLRKLTENEIRILLAQESPMKINEKSPEVFNHSTVENLSRSKGSSEAEDSVSKLCIEKITNEIISLIDPKMNLAETQDIIKKYNLNKQLQIRLTEERQITAAAHRADPVVSKPSYSSVTTASQKTEPVSSKPSFSSLTSASQKTEPVSSKPGFSSLTTASQKTEPVSSKPGFSSVTSTSQKTEPVSIKPGFSSLTSASQKTEPVSSKPGFSSLTSASQKTEPVSIKPGFSSLTSASQKTEPVSIEPGFSSLTSASQKTEPVSSKPGFSSLTPASQKTEPVSSKPGFSSLTPASQKTEPLGNKPTLSPLSFPKTMASLSKQSPFSNRTLDNPLNSITLSEISLLNQKMEKQPIFPNQTSPLNTLSSVNQRPLTSNKPSSPNSPKDKQSPERPLWSQRSEKHSLLAHKKPGTLDKQYRLSSTMPGSVVNDLSQSDKPAVLTTQYVDKLVTSPRLDKLSLLPSPRPGTLDKQYRLTPKDSSPLQRLANPLTLSSHMMSTPEQTTSLNLSQKATPRIYPPDVRCQSISRSSETKPSVASIVKNVDAKSSSTNATSKSIDAKTSSTNAPSKIIDAKTSSTNAPSKSVDAKSSSTNKSIDAKSSLTCTTSKSIVTKPTSTNTTSKSIDTKSSSTCKSIDAKSSSTNATIKSVDAKSSSTNATCKSVDAKPSSTNATSKSVDTKSSSTNATSESVDAKDSSTLTNSISKSIDQKSSGISNSKSINPKSRNISICKNTETKSSNNSINKSLDTRSSNTTGSTCHKASPNSLNQPNQTFSEVPITLSKTYQTIILDTRLNTNSPSKDSSSEPLKLDSKCVNNVQKTDCDKANLSRNRAKSVEEDNNMIADYIKDKKSDSKQSDHIPSSKNPPERQIIKAFEDKYEPKSSPTKNIRKYSNLGKKSPGKQSAKQDRNITKSLRTKKDTNYLEDYSSTDTSDDDMNSKTSTKSAPRKRKTAASTKEKALSEFSSDSDVDDMIEKIRTDERKKPRVKNEDAKKSANPESQKSNSKESSTSDKSDLNKSKKDRPSTEKKDTIKSKKEDQITGNRRLRNKQSVLYNLESLETDSDTPDEEIILVKRKSEEQGKKRKGKKSSTSENLESDEKESKNKKLKTEPEEVKPKRGRKKKQKEVEDNEPDKDSPKNDNRVEDETKETSESDSDVRKKKTLKKRSRKQNKQVDESSESETDDAKEKLNKKKTRKRNEDNIKKEDEEILLQTEECGTRKNLRRKPCHLYAENLSSNSEDDLELLIQNRSDEIETQNLMNHPRKSKKLLDQILAKSKQEAKEKSEDTRPSKRSCVNSDSSREEEEDDGKSKQSKGKKKIDKSKLTKTPKKSSSKQTKHSEESTSDSEKSSKKQVKTPKKDLKISKKSPEKSESPQEDGSENRSKRASRTQSMMINTSSDSEDDPLLAIAKTISRNEVRMSRRSIDLLHAKEKEILKKNETSDEEDSEEESDEEKVKKEAKIITKLSDSSSSKKKTKNTENKEELLKPIAASGKSSQCSSLDVSNKISSLIEKDKQKRGLDTSNDKEKTSSTLQQEAVQRLEKQPFTPEKKPMSREQLHSSWKSAFQNLKLPKTSPSVSKTPMDRNAWIRKHAMLTKPKTENKATFEPFKINYSRSSSPMSVSSHNSDHMATPVEGKHHNLPMPVEQTLKRMANISPKVNKSFHFEQKATPPPPVVEKLTPGKIEDIPKAGNFNESIIKWLNDSIPNDDSSCDDTNSTSKKLTSRYCDDTDTSVASSVIDKGIVSAPVQLKDIFSSPVSFTSEKISSVKVDDYKKLKQKSIFTSPSLDRKCRYEETPEKRKQLESETDSLVSDLSSCDETKHEKKAIFQQRRSLAERLKERQTQSSRAKVAFSPQNESSVYAFEPEPTETSPSTPFRRSNSKNTTPSPSMSKPGSPCNSSIAVQVNFESDTVLECSTTQTELSGSQADAGHLFYIPLQKNGQDTSSAIQGVAVKLGTEGPDQRVIMSAKLVTKPPASSDFAKPSSVSCLVPQRRVRPFNTPIVGTVQPMSRPTTGTQVSPRSQHTQTPPPPPKPSASSTTSSSSASTGTTKSEKKGKSKSSSSTSASVPNKKRHSSSPEPSTSSPSRSTPCATAVKHKNFPSKGSRALMVEAPTYYPTEKEFQDPFEYIEKIRPSAEQFGICRIVPPSSFKPECKLNDDMRFTAYNQYVHKMLHRWGPNVKEMVAIRKYLATQSVSMQQLPVIGGIEVDLPRLYSTVQQCGGLSEVIEKKRWPRVADLMRIPRLAQDRLSKLDDIYCKYLLPYDTLGHDERSKLFDAVEAEWGTHFNSSLEDEDEEEEDENNDDDLDECTVKGRSIPLSAFYRIARNTMAMYFKSDNPNDPGSNPSPTEVETEFWNHVTNRMLHICVHSASIDTGSNGCGFPTAKNSTFAKHPWNLKVLTNNSASILRSLNNVVGVTVPTLHVGMLFSACCWYRDPHGLPWIEYLHSGASKIWYGIPDEHSTAFRSTMMSLFPHYCHNDRTIWLSSDVAMVPPSLLTEKGVSLSRVVQDPGQFVLVFPSAFTSSIATGYLVAESVYFARPSWLDNCERVFKDMQDSSEPSEFSLELLFFAIAADSRSSADVLTRVLPMIESIRNLEIAYRSQLSDLGLKKQERISTSSKKGPGRKKAAVTEEEEEHECDVCRAHLPISMVQNSEEEEPVDYCLKHGIETLTQNMDLVKHCKLLFYYDEEELGEVISKLKDRIKAKSLKKLSDKTGA